MKRKIVWLLLFTLALTHAACSGGVVEPIVTEPAATSRPATAPGVTVDTGPNAVPPPATIAGEYDREDLDAGAGAAVSDIELAGRSIAFHGSGAIVDGSVITITAAGDYRLRGALHDGQIVVDTEDKETVRLLLDGVDIACSTSAPIYVRQAEKVTLTLTAGSENRVADGTSYLLADTESGEPNAAIFSRDDLTINGSGALIVQANYNHGIFSKDDLKITGGHITVNAVNDGLKGRDSIVIRDGLITINAGGDGLQASNDVDADKGYVIVEGGTIDITAALDGIQAETRLAISGGDITISAGGGSANSTRVRAAGPAGRGTVPSAPGSTVSTKGIKAGVDVTITGGTMRIDAADDAVHSNDSLTISGGDLVLCTGDDGIHADSTLEISGGQIRITESYEGIESARITIRGGTIHIVASDDGINASSGGGDFGMAGRPGQGGAAGNNALYIHDGYIVVDAMGDGLDVNGPIEMSGGTVIIHGPTGNMNGALDYTGSFKMTGGLLVAAGSAGMAQAPSTSSTQYAVIINFSSPLAAQTMVHLAADDGQEILTFAPTKVYQSVVLCSPELKQGATYLIYLGGSSTGTNTDGLYTGGAYTAGTQVGSFTVTSIVTGLGSGGGGGGRPRP